MGRRGGGAMPTPPPPVQQGSREDSKLCLSVLPVSVRAHGVGGMAEMGGERASTSLRPPMTIGDGTGPRFRLFFLLTLSVSYSQEELLGSRTLLTEAERRRAAASHLLGPFTTAHMFL